MPAVPGGEKHSAERFQFSVSDNGVSRGQASAALRLAEEVQMKAPHLPAFDEAVPQYFAELANRAKAQLHRVADGVYEVESRDFTVRIRQGTGHRKGILVTLVPTSEKPADIADLTSEIGLGVIAKFHGEKLSEVPLNSKEDYLRDASLLAAAGERFLLAYLLSLRNDFEQVKQFVVNSRRTP